MEHTAYAVGRLGGLKITNYTKHANTKMRKPRLNKKHKIFY